ncbi:anaerobic ribonucleoside-triphosphate reductase activating protein [Ammonifex degensii KC4]|uniref:Anaerobic ribonucleoside-triphosphate reductase activating protein n=1 Tax=Ammonifex degensii (strain DSM 10501 / KC4) TaxID=429009 RepID=C9RCQ4_AMMDK|nr:anaerobic ribonucleoside-triphosphate reductase activating protein [Ammonifex degensii]ACX52031.1 anaerobic ribonucleoside-triphosphate reductase activating protein [Ammonifex degensii KC4]
MVVGGLLKLSLSDCPGKPAAVVFTRGCNFRCPWCHNPGLVDPARYVPEVPLGEVLGFLERRRKYLDAVVVSGGEPTVQGDLVPFLRALKGMGYLVKLDTNGSNPGVLLRVLGESLVDCLAVDYKVPFRLYREWTGGDSRPVKESVILALSFPGGYIRTTVVPGIHTPEVLEEMREEMNRVSSGAFPAGKWRLQEFRPGDLLDPDRIPR